MFYIQAVVPRFVLFARAIPPLGCLMGLVYHAAEAPPSGTGGKWLENAGSHGAEDDRFK